MYVGWLGLSSQRKEEMAMKSSILAVEDDNDIQDLLTYNLVQAGYKVFNAYDGAKGLELANQHQPSLILLDIMLPEVDGLTACRRLKENPKTAHIPIIMLTAKGEENDIVLGLELGADDYMVKPFSIKELVARIRTSLRRQKNPTEVSPRNTIDHGPISMDLNEHVVKVEGESIKLTLAEFNLLKKLIETPGRVFTRNQLLKTVAGEDTFVIDRNVDVHIRALRKKLSDASIYVETVRGIGYKFKKDRA